MTEIPEHLLRRSRERREALGLTKPGEAGASKPEADATSAGEVEKAAAATPATTQAAAPAKAPAPAPPPPPKPLPPYIQAARRRKRIPFWAVPVLAALPVWALLYAFTLEPPSLGANDPLTLGKGLYEGNCASCHGVQGQGSANFPHLNDGEMQANWPDFNDHIEWVTLGSADWPGDTYGALNRPKEGGMPSWGEQLSEAEITLIVRYEREVLSGGDPEPELVTLTEQLAGEVGGGGGGGH